MWVAMRFAVGEGTGEEFAERARLALGVLAGCAGYRRGDLTRAYDDPTVWCLLTEWQSVGAYRRALGSFEVKMHAVPLLAQALDEPSAFEPLATAPPGAAVTVTVSDRAAGHGDPAGTLRSRP